MNHLHFFKHGLGDCIQFGAYLRHQRHYHPEDKHFVMCPRGCHTALDEVVDIPATAIEDLDPFWVQIIVQAQTMDEALVHSTHLKPKMDTITVHNWDECVSVIPGSPSTKAARCVRDNSMQIVPSLLRYSIRINHDRREAADDYINTLPTKKFAVLHYQGHTSKVAKSLHQNEASDLVYFLAKRGITPVILDWSKEGSQFADNRRIFNPGVSHPLWRNWGTGCAQTIAALMERAAVTVCIDSGPGKIALAVGTPAIQIWRHMHPLNYCDPIAEHGRGAIHLIPPFAIAHMHGAMQEREQGQKFFMANYRHAVYDVNHLGRDAAMLAWRLAEGLSVENQWEGGLKVVEPRDTYKQVFLNTERQPTPFAVGIPTLNRLDCLERCLESLNASNERPEVVFVIDNGQYLPRFLTARRFPVNVIRPKDNIGVAASFNLLHRLAKPLPLIICNDDVQFAPNSVSDMLSVEAPFVTALGEGEQWSCFYQSEECWQKIGQYDEVLSPFAYFEDNDFYWRMKLQGIEPFHIACGVQHTGSASRERFTPEQKTLFQKRWEETRARYSRKWLGTPGRETVADPEVI